MTRVLKRGDAQEAVRGWGRGWRDAAEDAAAPGAGRGRKDPPLEPPTARGPATPGFWTSGLTTARERISVVLSPSLWRFVTEALGP